MTEVTQILSLIQAGDQKASEELLPLVYNELRKLAATRMASQGPDHTLQATALVHEAYVRLTDQEVSQKWDSRGHFFGAVAEAMRRILIEHARRKQSLKLGGALDRQPVDLAEACQSVPNGQLIAIDDALRQLEEEDPSAAQIVKLRFFAACTMSEIAEMLGKSLRSVEREWRFARTWLHRKISSDTQFSV